MKQRAHAGANAQRLAINVHGQQIIGQVLPHFLAPHSAMIERATVARYGRLGPNFTYLEDFVAGKE